VRELLPALQETTFAVVAMQMERDAARAEAERLRLALKSARRGRAAARQQVAELEAELLIGPPWTCHVCGKVNNLPMCVICETYRPDAEGDGQARADMDVAAEHEFAVEAGHAAPDRVLPWLADLDPGDVQDLASALATATVGWQREPEITLARVEWALEEIRARVADGGEPPVVAYRSPQSGALYCVPCHAGDIYAPVTSEDLPDGGLCAACDVDVLIGGDPR
jgi:hypothetical protein